MNTVASVARSIKMDPKIARAKLRRFEDRAPIDHTKNLTPAEIAKVKEFLQTDFRTTD